MPQNKPMKIQWITVNGRQVPLVLPQTYSYADDDWKITSDQDPLPVVEYGTTAGGIVVPKRVSDDGHELTQLTGSRVEEHKRFVDINVTAGSLVWIDTNISIDSYRQFTVGVECRNPHNFEIICRYHGTQGVLLDEIVINADNKIRDLSDFKNSRSPRISIRVRNKSDVDQMYNVFLFGVK